MIQRHLILGNSAAGVSCAETLRRLRPEDEIVVVSDEPVAAYSRCLLSYYVGGEIARRRLTIRDPKWYAGNAITLLAGVRAVGLVPGKRVVRVERCLPSGAYGSASGETRNSERGTRNARVQALNSEPSAVGAASYRSELRFDNLLIATGASSITIPIPGIDARGVFHLRTLAHADGLLTWLGRLGRLGRQGRQARHAVVLGAGFIGMKAACALRKRGLAVSVVEKLDRIMPRTLDKPASDIVRRHLKKQGINCVTGVGATEVLTSGGVVRGVRLESGSMAAEVVIVAVGVRPNTGFLAGSGVPVSSGVVVDERMCARGNIFAAGDVAETIDFISGKRVLNALWPCAVAQGNVAAHNMAGAQKRYTFSMTMNSVELLGLPVVTLGVDAAAGADCETAAVNHPRSAEYRKLVFRKGRLIGATLVGEIERAGVLLSLIRRREQVGDAGNRILRSPVLPPPGLEQLVSHGPIASSSGKQ